jgi:hypothetical protein
VSLRAGKLGLLGSLFADQKVKDVASNHYMFGMGLFCPNIFEILQLRKILYG